MLYYLLPGSTLVLWLLCNGSQIRKLETDIVKAISGHIWVEPWTNNGLVWETSLSARMGIADGKATYFSWFQGWKLLEKNGSWNQSENDSSVAPCKNANKRRCCIIRHYCCEHRDKIVNSLQLLCYWDLWQPEQNKLFRMWVEWYRLYSRGTEELVDRFYSFVLTFPFTLGDEHINNFR